MFNCLTYNIVAKNKYAIRKLVSASSKTSCLQNAVPLYDFDLEQMEFLSDIYFAVWKSSKQFQKTVPKTILDASGVIFLFQIVVQLQKNQMHCILLKIL